MCAACAHSRARPTATAKKTTQSDRQEEAHMREVAKRSHAAACGSPAHTAHTATCRSRRMPAPTPAPETEQNLGKRRARAKKCRTPPSSAHAAPCRFAPARRCGAPPRLPCTALPNRGRGGAKRCAFVRPAGNATTRRGTRVRRGGAERARGGHAPQKVISKHTHQRPWRSEARGARAAEDIHMHQRRGRGTACARHAR